MTFEHTETATTTAAPDAVWALWSDLTTWAQWDPAIEGVDIAGDFVEGAAGTLTLGGGIEVPVTLDVVEEGRRFLDRLSMGELVITIDHVVTAQADGEGSDLVVTTVIDGPGADDIGPMVTSQSPEALASLAAMAEGR